MINIVLFVVGVILIIITVILILKDDSKYEEYYKDVLQKHKEIEEYANNIEDMLNSLERIIDTITLDDEDDLPQKPEIIQDDNKDLSVHTNEKNMGLNHDYSHEQIENKEKNKENNIKDEIFKLSDLGLSSNEIAKRLNRGKREVDIILKLKDGNNK